MYILTDVSLPQANIVLAETSSVADAIAAASEFGKIYLVEEDEAYPDHYDLISWKGNLFTIQPKKVR